jgi:hypothetical protein
MPTSRLAFAESRTWSRWRDAVPDVVFPEGVVTVVNVSCKGTARYPKPWNNEIHLLLLHSSVIQAHNAELQDGSCPARRAY